MNNLDITCQSISALTVGDDRAKVLRHADATVIIVADGAGGSSGGAEAAQMLVALAETECTTVGVPVDDIACCALLTRLDADISREGQAGETTAVIAVITSSELYGASVGDSGAWLVLANDWFDLTGAQSRKPLLGWGDAESTPFSAELREGSLIIATDGLWNYASQDRILNIMRSGGSSADIADSLVSAARLPNGELCDDITVVVCKSTV